MDDRNAQIGWTDAQWNRVRQAIAEEWRRVRVAGSFLLNSGSFPPSTQVVPSEVLDDTGQVDYGATAQILEISTSVQLSRQEISEDDLSSAILVFRRATTAIARDEDVVIFNGQQCQPINGGGQLGVAQAKARADARRAGAPPAPPIRFPAIEREGGEQLLRLASAKGVVPGQPVLAGAAGVPFQADIEKVIGQGLPAIAPNRAANPAVPSFFISNPGSLGLVYVAATQPQNTVLTGPAMVTAMVEAISTLDDAGYGPPFVAVLSRAPYATAHDPLLNSLVLPADRIEPLIGRPLLRSAALDIGLKGPVTGRGLLISLAGDAIDIAIASEATAEFTQVTASGKFAFRVFERLALRVKDNNAIVRIDFVPAAALAADPAADPRRSGAA